jgi:hypothetical protein
MISVQVGISGVAVGADFVIWQARMANNKTAANPILRNIVPPSKQ